MDIKAKAEEIISKIKSDGNIKDNFEKDPVKTVEGILGVDLPDDVINNIVEAVKAKLSADSIGGIASKIGGLFGKK